MIATLILHYKVDKLANAVLVDLFKQSMSSDIYVIDNGSPEPFVQTAEGKPVETIRLDQNYLFSGGYNRGVVEVLKRKPYDFLWFVTSDVGIPQPGILAQLIRDMHRHPRAAAVLMSMPSNLQQCNPWAGVGVQRVRFLEWTAPLVRTKAWLDVGPFVEDLRFYGMEFDWFYRARMKDWYGFVDYTMQLTHGYDGTWKATEMETKFPYDDRIKEMDAVLRRLWGHDWYVRLWPEHVAWWQKWQAENGV
jgi:GT2 family glycosyltransferase